MQKGQRITIERVENGYLVGPEHEPGMPIDFASYLVFNDMGYASSPGDCGRECLLTFIEAHFRRDAS